MTRIAKLLAALWIATLAAAAVALTVAIMSLQAGQANLRTGRFDGRRDTCRLITGLAYAATANNPKARQGARRFIDRTPLRDCNLYARTGR